MPEQFDRRYADFAVGDHVIFTRRFGAEDFEGFAALSGDRNPLHHDAAYAAATGLNAPILPLHLTAAPLSAIAGMMLPGHRSLYLQTKLRALEPARYGRDITYSAKVVAKNEAKQTLTLRTLAFEGSDLLLEAEMLVRVRDDAPASLAPRWDGQADIRKPPAPRAVITGATGEIGGAIAEALARAGWHLVLLHRGRSETAKTIKRSCTEAGAEVTLLSGGLDDARALGRICRSLASRDDVTALIHAASPGIEAGLDDLMAVNLRALTELTAALLPGMLGRQEGRVLFIGSSAVQHGPKAWADYVAAKTAASQWVTGFDSRYGGYGISGTVLAPGYVRTRFSERHRPPGAAALLPEQVAEAAADCLSREEKAPGNYLWLESQTQRWGRFGFHQSQQIEASPSRDRAANTSRPPAPAVAAGDESRAGSLIRSFLGASNGADMSDAGVDQYPGWDSLRHIELMLYLEKELGIAFNSAEIERTTRFTELCALVTEKLDV